MQRLYTILITLVLFIGATFARTPQEAAQIASEFIHQRYYATSSIQRMQSATRSSKITTPVELAYTHTQQDGFTPAIYVFNGKEEEGFVLVSAEDNARAVLGYADQGSFDSQNIPSNMQVWLQMYAEELAYAHLMPQASANNDRPLGTQYPTIAPLLGDTQWGQGEPYNNHCPLMNGERAVSGCVATAISQIMYKHKYPKQGTGSHSYHLSNYGTISVDYSKATYDWDNMLPRYARNSYTTVQANAVAQLMYHVGVSANMHYTPQASGTASGIALQGLNKYFGYDAGIVPLLKDFMPESEVLEGIATDLKAGLPVYISAVTTNYEGHAFVCDGMQSNGYLHINWGWSGTSDGYFSISALDPGQQGTGGSASNLAFTVDVCAYTNIRPNEGGKGQVLYTADGLTRTTADVVDRNNSIKYSLYILTNNGTVSSTVQLGYYVYDTNDELVAAIKIGDFNMNPGYYLEKYSLSGRISSSIPEGDYYLIVGYKDDNEEIHPILIKGKGVVKNSFTIQDGKITFHAQSTPDLPDSLVADFAQISGTNKWQMDLYTPDFWEGTDPDGMVLRCVLNSNSATSVIGTYLLDKTSKTTTNSIHLADAICAMGNGKEHKQYTPNSLELTIVSDENDKLYVYYSFEVNFIHYTGYASIITPTWNQLVGEQLVAYDNNVTYEAATALPATQALEIAKRHKDTYSMEYLVKGVVSNMVSTPTTILQEQEAEFAISDNGEREDRLVCNHIQWLNQTAYTSGEEIQTSDEIVILGPLTTQEGTPQINGSCYAIQRPEWTAPITEFTFNTDAMKMIAKWTSTAKYFKVRLYDKNDKKIADNTISKKELTATMPELGAYTFWIRPMDNKKKEYVGPAIEKAFIIDGTPAGVDNAVVTSGAVLYDLLGNIVDMRTDDDIHQLNIPQSGIYILKNQEAKVVFLHK